MGGRVKPRYKSYALTEDELKDIRKLIKYCLTGNEIQDCLKREHAKDSIKALAKGYQADYRTKDTCIDNIVKVEMILRRFELLPSTAKFIHDKHRVLIDSEAMNKYAMKWSKHMLNLVDYLLENGDCEVPRNHTLLGEWVHSVREGNVITNGSGPLDSLRRSDLNSLAFVWDMDRVRWERRFQQLKQYAATFGNCNVPRHYAPNPKLGIWVTSQRTNYRKYQNGDRSGQMTPERIERLVSIGFEWMYVSPSTKRCLAILKAFWISTGRRHCHIPYPTTTTCPLLKSVWPWANIPTYPTIKEK